jgi:hydroxyacylglutathione hydrolase
MTQAGPSFGKISVIWGDKNSLFPYCNTLFVDGKVRAVIDPGSSSTILAELAERGVDQVINSHFHFDHIRFNHLFPNADIVVHEYDKEAMSDKSKFAVKYSAARIEGMSWVERLVSVLNGEIREPEGSSCFAYDPEFYRGIGRVSGTYEGDRDMSLGDEYLEVIHTPGHADSMCCFFFPSESLCYVSDYNVLTEWGPWYGGEDSDIGQMIRSADKVRSVKADYFVSAHDRAVLSRSEFLHHLERFLRRVEQRNRTITTLIAKGLSFQELISKGLFYDQKYHNKCWVKIWETMMLIKHLEHMGLDELIPEYWKTEARIPGFHLSGRMGDFRADGSRNSSGAGALAHSGGEHR